MIIYILLYVLSIFVLYFLVLIDLFKKPKSKSIILLQNNYELRGGGGLITQTLEVYTYLGIPYKITKNNFSDINKFKEKSFSPFFELLSKNMIFRDTNYSFFQTENLDRFIKFYKKSFPNRKIPNNWIIINFTFIENIINLFPFIKINGLKLSKCNIFRILSHITTDNPAGPEKRKFILFSLALKMMIYIIFIPFLIHIILTKIALAKINKNIFLVNKNYKDKIKYKNRTFLGIEENNLLGRKDNRFIQNFIEYNFYINKMEKEYISGVGKIKIHKTLFADDSFPISGKYSGILNLIHSNDFKLLDNKYKIVKINNGGSYNGIFNFSFKIKKEGIINIINQSGIKNTISSINIQTQSFKYYPKTNLKNKKDHWNNQIFINQKKDIKIKYNIKNDNSKLKIQSRFISIDGKIQINLQKEILNINIKKSYILYNGEKTEIKKIEHSKGNKTCIFIYYKKGFIPKYTFDKVKSAKIILYEIKDSSEIIHYKKGREISLPWK